MFKKIALILICVISCIFPLSGCSLFALDTYTYLNQVVVTFDYPMLDGEKKNIKIIKKDVIEAYNNYKSTLQQSGYSGQGALDQMIQLLINKQVVLAETEKLIAQNEIVITDNILNEMWNQTYKAIIKNLAEFESAVIKSWNLHIPSELEPEEEDENIYYQPYEKQAELVKVQNEWKIRTIDTPVEPAEPLSYERGKEIETLFQALNNRVEGSNVLKEAFKRYNKLLKNNEQGMGLSDKADEIFEREITRIYNNIKENKLISLYSEYYEVKNGYSIISVNEVLNYITAHMLASYTQYSIDFTAYENDILSNREKVWYMMDDDYFYVSHILIPYSDEQKQDLKDAENAWKTGGISYEAYQNYKTTLANSVVVKDYGVDTNLAPAQLLENLRSDLAYKTDAEKINIFNEYLYKYSSDNGNKNKIFEYVVGTEKSKMVEGFTEAARVLYNNGNGELGDLSELVPSEYGVHIVFYIEPVTNMFAITNPNSFSLVTSDMEELDEIINKINTTKLSQMYERTVFDYVYEKLVKDNFAQFENMNLSILKADLNILIYHDNYADLWQ